MLRPLTAFNSSSISRLRICRSSSSFSRSLRLNLFALGERPWEGDWSPSKSEKPPDDLRRRCGDHGSEVWTALLYVTTLLSSFAGAGGGSWVVSTAESDNVWVPVEVICTGARFPLDARSYVSVPTPPVSNAELCLLFRPAGEEVPAFRDAGLSPTNVSMKLSSSFRSVVRAGVEALP